MIDGFPREPEQAAFMSKKMEEYKREYVVIHFSLTKEKALERMKHRATTEARKDDTPEAMERRIQEYITNTEPVIKHFEDLGKVITINADDTIENIQADLRTKLGL